MPTNHGHANRDKNTQSLPQTPGYAKLPPDGRDIEFSQELADADDLQAQERAKAADARAKSK
ncbi:YfhD family protein [Bacillus suaedaesalsae]|uniref:YfhD family protein n=1 Tax=Bacillus suaedaesalsae TaxID=2810349 RepID=A0ABS2DDD6_9BACI|nr:YfhD family protein [Bacillus suaedaesalsae]MBM6616472.1 YfhD family protein [Bacillus suaedaesalsae]